MGDHAEREYFLVGHWSPPMQLDEPNFSVSLAASYNPRGIAGYTNTQTNALDQRKINSMYEPVQNSLSGKTTLYLTKRPGLQSTDPSAFGISGQAAYLLSQGASLFGNGATDNWVFSTSGSDCRASSLSTTTVILSAASYYPGYVDKTAISGADTLVVQLLNASTADQRTFYSTAIATFTEISDSVFTALTHTGKMEHLNGFAHIADKATGRICSSALNSLATWPANSYIAKQAKQDGMRGLAKCGAKIACFGHKSVEVFFHAQTETGSPLLSTGITADIGLYGAQEVAGYTHYYATSGGRIYFVGNSGLGGAALYMFDGAKFEKVSRGPFDKIITENAINNSIYSVMTVVFGGKEAIALQLTITTAATQRWLMFFPDWNDWFEWNSTVFTPVNSGRWYLGVGANQHFLNAFRETTPETWTDPGPINYQVLHQFQVPKGGSKRKFMRWCGVVGDTSASALNLAVEFSDDDGVTWSTARNIDMTAAKKNIYRCGSYTDGRLVRLSYTGARDLRLEKFVARID